MSTIRIRVELPPPVDHGTTIAAELKKNAVIDRVNHFRVQYGLAPFECIYDEKKYASIDKAKLEKDLKAAIGKLGYKVR
jgi:hypothetical protein